MDGIIIVDKPKGFSSRDVVNIISKRLNTKKVGHTGTLDPIATGVLVICVNGATKLVDRLSCTDKKYVAKCLLGIKTDTLDNTGKILAYKDTKISESAIKIVLDSFVGSYLQEVPIFSAIKVNGKKLYEYARENKKVKLPKREVKIKSIKLIESKIVDNKTEFTFECSVSKGTYIRALIRDIAIKLNTYGIMTDLRRVKQGKFTLDDAIKIDDELKIIPIDKVLNCKCIPIEEEIKKRVLNGANVVNKYNSDEILFTLNGPVALYEKDKNNKNELKISKMFVGGKL